MSHYSLMVKINSAVGTWSTLERVASLMAPYQGVRCDMAGIDEAEVQLSGEDGSEVHINEGCPKKHLEFYDIEEEFLKNYFNDVFSGEWIEIEHPEKIGKSPCEVWDTFESYMENWIGYTCRDSEKGRFGYWENPNRKWSSYKIGGLWKSSFHLKSGEVVDVAKLGDIDWKVMSQQVDENITNFWLRHQRYSKGLIKGSRIESTLNKLGLRKIKKDPERIRAILETGNPVDSPPEIETISFTLDDLRTKYRWWWDFGTFAVLDDNGWNQQGQMYMLGMSDETEERREEWGRSFFDKWIKDEDPNSWAVIVHCSD
jgi:hypothetical protein